MKIKKLRIENFRSFIDQEFELNRYSCFVGPNGAGKSTVLCALNVFFKEQDSSATDTSKLCDEDFFARQTDKPIRITVTFDDLSDEAKTALGDYVRQNELVVTAEAIYDESSGLGNVRHFGQRLGMAELRPFFEAIKGNAKADELSGIYTKLQETFTDLPAARSKDAKADALRQYESEHPDKCVLIPSEDNFYGINSTGKLGPFVQWVYVPAVKDAGQEGQEAKNTAFGKLIARTVRSRTNFDDELNSLKQETLTKYKELLDKNRAGLDAISESLQKRLESWAHPNVRIGMEWLSDPSKSVQVAQPVAGIKTGDGDFLGSLARMGHGLQRSYLLALLQELASSDAPNAPTLILACEEPELYQHPPQARHLADVFVTLAQGNNQVLVTTHSPLFVSGDGFENVRLVRTPARNRGSLISSLTFETLCARIRTALGEDPSRKLEGLIAKIHQALRPHVAEMFFTRVPILVEGLEDASYITTTLHLSGQWAEFRRLGCHIIPVNGKDKLIQPLAIAKELGIPAFVVFDADGDTVRPEHRVKHERDNKALINLLGSAAAPFPAATVLGDDHAIWQTNLTLTVDADFGVECSAYKEAARVHYAQEGGLEKHDLYIADWLSAAHADGKTSNTLADLCTAILKYATNEVAA
ncbi:MAG: AAA family ATPase [Planctomyces sp.]|nr:AAA family ATPase [Planctomyces sp.]